MSGYCHQFFSPFVLRARASASLLRRSILMTAKRGATPSDVVLHARHDVEMNAIVVCAVKEKLSILSTLDGRSHQHRPQWNLLLSCLITPFLLWHLEVVTMISLTSTPCCMNGSIVPALRTQLETPVPTQQPLLAPTNTTPISKQNENIVTKKHTAGTKPQCSLT